MLTEQQREALAEIENHLGAQDHRLAHALDTMALPLVVSRSRRTVRWAFLATALSAPVVTVTALALMPVPSALILLAGVMLTASVRATTAVRKQHIDRRHRAVGTG